jgi:hypothetical protein
MQKSREMAVVEAHVHCFDISNVSPQGNRHMAGASPRTGRERLTHLLLPVKDAITDERHCIEMLRQLQLIYLRASDFGFY